MKYSRFEEVPVWRDAIALARRIYDLTTQDISQGHPGLRDQLERAALSVSNNIAEGFERGSTKELLAFLYIARGSAGEVRSMLCVLEGWKTRKDLTLQISDLKQRCERISRQLYGWIESLKNSDIKGQRHLNDQVRTQSAGKKEQEAFLKHLESFTKPPQDNTTDDRNTNQ